MAESNDALDNLSPGTLLDGGRMRVEHDSLGGVAVPHAHLWGAETQRSLTHFSIGEDRMPIELYHAYGHVKKAAARVNATLGRLPNDKADLIVQVADEVIAGTLDDEFPLYVWQTGSGTQTNMNVNEVIANRAIQIVGGTLGTKNPIDPKEHVNLSQSSNDTFPTAMHIACAFAITRSLLPRVEALASAIERKSAEWQDELKVGRTHLQDAVPLTVGQEWSGYAAQLRNAIALIRGSLSGLYKLAAGGTAVGTGLNAPAGFGEAMAAEIAQLTGLPFVTAPNKFEALASLDAMVAAHAALRALAVALMKIANDIRWLASGPRCGLGELNLPANEPGSSIMPGKVNPTQCEAMVMICTQVFGNDLTVALSGAQGNFELNVMRPVVIRNCLHSIRILGDGCEKFRVYSIEGITLNRERINEYLQNSLALVTALSPEIGYENAARIAKQALETGATLREAALRSGLVGEATFDRLCDPRRMV